MINRFKELRRILNLTLEDVGKALNTTTGTVGNWEQRGTIPAGRIYQIAEVFGVNAEWLRTGAGDMFTEENTKAADLTDKELAIEVGRRIFERLPENYKQLAIEFANEVLLKEQQERARNAAETPEQKRGPVRTQTNNGTVNGPMIQK